MVMLATSSAPGTSAPMVSGMAASSAPEAACTLSSGKSATAATETVRAALVVPPSVETALTVRLN